MVVLHVKRGEESLFLHSCSLETPVSEVLPRLVNIHNGRRKVARLAEEVLDLAKHGVAVKPELAGLLAEQVKELKLVDEYEEQCLPSGGFAYEADPVQRRNGRAPTKAMKEVLQKAVAEVKARVSRDNIKAGVEVNEQTVKESLDLLRGATSIVWPMGLPPTDPVRLELENCEDLAGTQESKMVLDPAKATLWFATKELLRDKQLKDFLGKNEKTKVVVKLATMGSGPPAREPAFTEEQRKSMMLAEHRRREELKKLMEDEEDEYLGSAWADPKQLASGLQGVSNVSWRPK